MAKVLYTVTGKFQRFNGEWIVKSVHVVAENERAARMDTYVTSNIHSIDKVERANG